MFNIEMKPQWSNQNNWSVSDCLLITILTFNLLNLNNHKIWKILEFRTFIHHDDPPCDAELAKYFTVLVQSWQLIAFKAVLCGERTNCFRKTKAHHASRSLFCWGFLFCYFVCCFRGGKNKQCFETERSNLDGLLKSFNVMNVCERVEERQHFLQQTSQARIYLYLSPKIIHYMYNETLIY